MERHFKCIFLDCHLDIRCNNITSCTWYFLAIIVNQPGIKGKAIIRTIFILPWAVPAFVSILVFAGMFNETFGAINNQVLALFGIEKIAWMTDPFWSKIALIMIQTWLGSRSFFAMTTGILQSIPGELYEAATVDGATAWQQFCKITLPLVLYATAPILITQYTFNFNNFSIIYLFNNGDLLCLDKMQVERIF